MMTSSLATENSDVSFGHFDYYSMQSLGNSSNLGYMCLRMESFSFDNCLHIGPILTEQMNFAFGIQLSHAHYHKSHKLLPNFANHYVLSSYQTP